MASAWTLDTLKEYLDDVFHQRDTLHVERIVGLTHRVNELERLIADVNVVKQDVVAAKLASDALKEYLVQLMIERDARYGHRLGELEGAVKDISFLKQSVQSAADAIKAQERHVAIVQAASQVAIDKAEKAQELRNAVANEFRATLDDQGRRQMPRAEGEAAINALRAEVMNRFDAVEKRAEEERRRADRNEGKSLGSGATVAFIVTAIGVVGTVIAIVLSLH